MSKRKKTTASTPEPPESDIVTMRAVIPPEVVEAVSSDAAVSGETEHEQGRGHEHGHGRHGQDEHDHEPMAESVEMPIHADANADEFDSETTVNLVGDLPEPGRDDLDEPTVAAPGEALADIDRLLLQRRHLRGLLEALVFASDSPIKPNELAKLASAPVKQVKELLAELKVDFSTRGVHLDEVAGGWVFRTSPQYAPFVRDLTKQRPVRLTRAQVETLAIIGYRQPITRPEVDDVRGVDSGPVLKLLLERDLVRILGKRDEPGRPLIYGTTTYFLEFFGLKSLKDLPTLREFTELSDESRETFEDELGETPEDAARRLAEEEVRAAGLGEGESGSEGGSEGGDEGRDVRESMSVPVGEQALEDLGADDLEPIDEAEVKDQGGARHVADDDGPTLTSEAPPPPSDDD